jgi:hypothetical protein
VAQAAKEQGVQCATVHVKEHFPAEGIIDCAEHQGCDLIVMASHGRRGLSRLLLGSQTTRVLTLGTVPVLVCRQKNPTAGRGKRGAAGPLPHVSFTCATDDKPLPWKPWSGRDGNLPEQ